MQDLMWKNFVPLWKDLCGLSEGLLLTGGYALYLKQKWLLANRKIRTVVDIEQWLDAVPRATLDFDVIADIELIADIESNMKIAQVVDKHAFAPSEKFWKFKKTVDDDRYLILEFHAVPPLEKREDLRIQAYRVKSRTRKQTGIIHGRENPEAQGCNVFPFSFNLDGLDIAIPNTVSLVVMKLSAMRDRWDKANDTSLENTTRAFHRKQAEKHAKDVFRAIAMLTAEENTNTTKILESMVNFEILISAANIFKTFFVVDDDLGKMMVASDWSGENLDIMLSMLKRWFAG